MTLAEALRIALDNGERVRVYAFSALNLPVGGSAAVPTHSGTADRQSRGVGMAIGRLNADTPAWQFKTEVMAHCRSVEEQYWNLSVAHVHLWSAELAAKLGQEIKDRETAELARGRGAAADVAEASERLEQFNLDLVTRTSDVITSERQLRNIMGLPASDHRRIIPVTTPTEARFEPDWQSCLGQMLEHQPEIVLIKVATGEKSGPGASQSAEQREVLKQAVERRTRSLARAFSEIEGSYRQFKTASRLRTTAAQRLDAQREFYEKGRITVDRVLDAVSQSCVATATEAQYRSTYNNALALLEEAKGTLLAYDNITVIDDISGSRATPSKESREGPVENPALEAGSSVDPVTHHEKADFRGAGSEPKRAATEAVVNPRAQAGQAPPKVWNFSFSIGGDRPFVIKGTISESSADPASDTGQQN